MYLSIRDDIVFAAGYTTLAEGLRDLNIEGVELFVNRDDTVSAIAPAGDRVRLDLTVSEELAELQAQASAHCAWEITSTQPTAKPKSIGPCARCAPLNCSECQPFASTPS